jgi:threonine dehydrogenase-like Zn-dependent dehydrogenase
VYSRQTEDSDRASLVRSFGAQYISADETPLAELSARMGKADVIFEAVGSGKVAFSALDALAPNGVFIFSGVPGINDPVPIDLDAVMRNIVLKNQVLFGTVNASRAAFEAAVRQLEQFVALFPQAVSGLISSRVPLKDAPKLLQSKGGGIKHVISLAA